MAYDIAEPVLLRRGIFASKRGSLYIDDNWTPGGVSEQFADDADTYHAMRNLDFTNDLERCFTLAQIDRGAKFVLDIGSGAGSTALAASELLPEATIVASDISPQLLSILARTVEADARLRRRIKIYCFDLHAPFFEREQFDLIVGWAVLHHLTDPYAALKNVAESLKPGGKLMMNEPLEAGCLLLGAVYEKCIKVLMELGLGDGVLAEALRAQRFDMQHRLGVPVVQSWTAGLDDKWLFDEPYLMELSEQLGFRRVEVHPVEDDMTRVYEGCLRSLLFATGNAELDVPQAVYDVIREFDRGIAPELKRKLSPAGLIIFTK
ncbi:MAG TPA: class I SAM-dependent methyltransferase [Vicinamibacterales bacterium]|nr:class I SAM-dependent methyltransferase [Vicinamibacterales bacterium]